MLALCILEHVEPAQHPYHMQYGELMEQGQIHTYQGQGRQKAVLVKRFFGALLVRRPIQLYVRFQQCVPCFETLYQESPVPPGLSGQDKKLRPVRRRNHQVAHPQQLPLQLLGRYPPVQGFQYTFAINGPVPDGGDGGGVQPVPDPAQLHLIHG